MLSSRLPYASMCCASRNACVISSNHLCSQACSLPHHRSLPSLGIQLHVHHLIACCSTNSATFLLIQTILNLYSLQTLVSELTMLNQAASQRTRFFFCDQLRKKIFFPDWWVRLRFPRARSSGKNKCISSRKRLPKYLLQFDHRVILLVAIIKLIVCLFSSIFTTCSELPSISN